MKRVLMPVAIVWAIAVPAAAAETLIVENGEPRAEIIIAAKPERTVRLAAMSYRVKNPTSRAARTTKWRSGTETSSRS